MTLNDYEASFVILFNIIMIKWVFNDYISLNICVVYSDDIFTYFY